MKRIVARLLALANAAPPFGYGEKERFYALKDRLCRRYGRLVGTDVQEITHECWCYGRFGVRCHKCGGSGVYRRTLVELERWDICGRIFHRPTRRWSHLAGRPVTIKGYIRHKSREPWNREAMLWLCLIFDRPLFGQILRFSYVRGWTPLCLLNRIVFWNRVRRTKAMISFGTDARGVVGSAHIHGEAGEDDRDIPF